MKIALFLIIACLSAGIMIYNRLVAHRNRVEAAWSDIEVQLTRRYDLVPQLVSTVKKYSEYEKTTLAALTELRAQALALRGPLEKSGVEERLGQSVLSILALAEEYPQLKASDNFLELQRDLVEIEDYLQSARRYYNGAVKLYNISREVFPNNLISSSFGFLEAEFFEMEEDAANVPTVDV